MPDGSWLASSNCFVGRMCSFWGSPAAGFRWPRRLPARSWQNWTWWSPERLAAPLQPELTLGAVTADGARFTNLALVRDLKLSAWLLRVLADEQRAEARWSEPRLRGRRLGPRLLGRTVIVVDDGLATGATMRAALRSVHRGGPARVVAAAPVVAKPTAQVLRAQGSEVVCILEPDPFFAVGLYYEHFEPVSNDAVRQLLAEGTRSVRSEA